MDVFIKQEEFSNAILDFILTEEYKEYLKHMYTTNDEEFRAGFVQGLCWASILTGQMPHYVGEIK